MTLDETVDLGMDCEWYAVDSNGCIAFFTTAGAPYMPEWYWPKPKLLLELAVKVKGLPVITSYELTLERMKGANYGSWIEASVRGLFGYDYDVYNPTRYKIVSRPIQVASAFDAGMEWGRGLPFYKGEFGTSFPAIKAQEVLRWAPVAWPAK